ncbi:MAG: branched-chain amino acid ABC transporter permease [Vallitaleaceae bacterium]|nr:branched-chain amino acid ABC transporter permease [Vallitaleaceae bacterium]
MFGILLLFFCLYGLLLIGVLNDYHKGVLIFIGINIIAAASLNLATGFLGQLALGHAGFIAIGAYSAAIFSKWANATLPLPDMAVFILSLLIAGAIAAVFGILIGIPALRLRGDYLGIVTLGFGEIIRISIFNLKFTGGARPYMGIPNYSGFIQIFFLVVIVLTALYLLIRSRHGRAILSIREDEIAAESVGIPTTFYKIFGFATSAFFAGIAGAAMAFKLSIIDPKKFTFMFSVEIFVIVVLGGMGSLTGTVIAAVVLGILNEFLHYVDKFRLVLYSLLLIGMMIFRPEGLFGTREFSFAGFVRKMVAKNKQKKETV